MLSKLHIRALVPCLLLLTLLTPQPVLASAAPDAPGAVSFTWSAIWGDAPQPGFGQATGIDVGPDGNVYISDAVRNDIQVFTPSGELVRRFGSAGSNAGQFREPADVAVRNDKVYVADQGNARIQVLTSAGAPLMQIDGRQPIPGSADVRLPARVGVDAAGRIFLFNYGDAKLYRYSAQGVLERRYDEPCIIGAYHGLAVLSSGVVFCSAINGGFWRLPLDGAGTLIGDNNQPGALGPLVQLAAAPDDSVWAYRNQAVWSYTPQAYMLIHLSPDGAVLGQYPTTDDILDIAASSDRIYALTANRRVRVYDWAGQALGEWGGDAFAGQNTYERPDRIAAAPDGTFYVLERERKRVRHVAADGTVLAVLAPNAGQGNLSEPIDMAVDALGRLYVLDLEYFARIVRFTDDRFDMVLNVLSSSPYINEPRAINITGDTVVLVGFQPGSLAVYRMDLRGGRIGQAPVKGAEYRWYIDAALGTGDRLFTLDAQGSPTVRAVDFYGNQLAAWGANAGKIDSGAFVVPTDISADLRGRVFVSDTESPPMINPPVRSSRVQVFDENGAFLTQFGGYGSAPGQFVNPEGVAVLADGRAVVADTDNNRLQVFTPSGDLPALQPLPKPQSYPNPGPWKLAGWQDLGPHGIGSFSDILIPPQPSAGRPIIGVYGGGLALSTDGIRWSRQPGRSVPTGEQLLYAGSRTLISSGSYGDAAYRSDDLGRTWIRLGDLPSNGPRFIAPSPTYDQDGTLFLAAYMGGVWQSMDAGATWELRGGRTGTFYGLVAFPDGGKRTLLAVMSSGVLRSTDDGATWQAVNVGGASSELYVSPSVDQDHTIFATDFNMQSNGLYRSTDGGLTWTVIGADTGMRWGNVNFSPAYATDKTILTWSFGNPNSLISKDGGNTWTQLTAIAGPPVRWITFAPTYATDGAIWRQRFEAAMGIEVTRDAGASWQLLAAAPGIEVHALSRTPNTGGSPWAATPYGPAEWVKNGAARLLYAFANGWGGRVGVARSPTFPTDGTGIAGGVITHDGGNTWQELPFAFEVRYALGGRRSSEAVEFSPNYAQDGLVLVAFDEPTDATSELRRSNDHGATWENLKLPVSVVRSIVFEPSAAADRRIYAGGERGVAVSSDGGATWTNAVGPLALLKVTGLAVRLEGGSPVVYAATSSEGMWRSTDRGQTWAKSNAGLGDGYLCALDGNEDLLATVTCAGQVYLWAGTGWGRVDAPISGAINDVMVEGTAAAGSVTVGTSLGAFSFSLPAGEPLHVWLPLLRR